MASRDRVRFGPGLLVAAAFIGPGTVVTASRAGAEAGCELLWAVLFATVGAILLQLFAARIGILSGQGLGEKLRAALGRTRWYRPVAALVVCAIGIGNAAYQTGNLSGAAAGLGGVAGGRTEWWIVALAVCTLGILAIGRYRTLQGILIGLVVVLSMCFLATAAISMPPVQSLIFGLVTPYPSRHDLTLVLALIGTTIVPYNLFLHASSAAENWRETQVSIALRQSMLDTILSIGLGGLVTAAILVTASQAFFAEGRHLGELSDIADQLRPVLGGFSGLAFAIGLFAAGLTSAITAPLATAYALCGILGWSVDARGWHFRGVAGAIVLSGTLFAVLRGGSPAQVIVLAQLANGLLLPVVAILILWLATKSRRLPPPRLMLYSGWSIVIAVTLLAGWRIFQAVSGWL